MKYFLLSIALFCLSSFQSFSQSQKLFSYLIVEIGGGYDAEYEKTYYAIAPQGSDSINGLVNYSRKQRAKGAAPFYDSVAETDTAKAYFNYFTSISRALQFLDERGWKLLTVISTIQSYNSKTDIFLNTRPVYYLRKERK